MSGPAISSTVSSTVSKIVPQAPVFFPVTISSDKRLEDTEAEERALVRSLPDPVWVEALRMQQEIIKFQAECKNPELNALIDEVLRLKQVDAEHTLKETQFKKLIEAYAIPLLKLVQHDLYRLIHGSPVLKKRLVNYLELHEEKEVDLRSVITALEKEVQSKSKAEAQDHWVLIEPDKEHAVISMDEVHLQDIKLYLTLIQSVISESTSSKEFLVQAEAFKKNSRLPKPEIGLSGYYEVAYDGYMIIKGLAFVGRVAQVLSPALCTSLKLLFPPGALFVINFLMTVLMTTAEAES